MAPRGFLAAASPRDEHEESVAQKFAWAEREQLAGRPIGNIIAAVGISFLEAPYRAHTLEVPGEERLVVNVAEFDCVTFVETTLALARCIKMNKTSFADFTGQLQLIRYRGGVIDGYPSRLHYFSDWIHDNEAKGIVRNVTGELGGVPLNKAINYMSTHRKAYRQLASKRFFSAIKTTEAELNKRRNLYIPTQQVRRIADQIVDGDIIGITTTMKGLDVNHTGLACRFQGYMRFLHAPLSEGTVQITKRTIEDHLGQSESRTGLILARPVEP